MPEIRFVATIGPDQLIRLPNGVLSPGDEVEVVIRAVDAAPVAVNADDMAETRAWLLSVVSEIEATAPPLPTDMAINHDHYAHGKPLP